MLQPNSNTNTRFTPGSSGGMLGAIGTTIVLIIIIGLAAGLALSGGLRELTMTEVERAARAEQAWLNVKESEAALPAVTLRNQLIYTSVGISIAVLVIGGALALVVWLNRKASEIRPNEAGLYPVIVRTVFGGVLLHDPNRGMGPTTVYRTPTWFDALANLVFTLRNVKPPEWMSTTPPTASYPAPADAQMMDRIAERAAAVQLTAAATRHPQPSVALPTNKPVEESLPRTQVINANIDDPRLLAVARQLGDSLPREALHIIDAGTT